MTVSSYVRGHRVEIRDLSSIGSAWVYADTGEVVPMHDKRPCPRCGRPPTDDGHDACLGHINGVDNACCGHGVEEGYQRSERQFTRDFMEGWLNAYGGIIGGEVLPEIIEERQKAGEVCMARREVCMARRTEAREGIMNGTWKDAYTGEPYPPIERDAEPLEVTGGLEYDTAQLPLHKRFRMAWMAITGRTICIRVGVIHVTTKSKGDVCSAEQPSDSPG